VLEILSPVLKELDYMEEGIDREEFFEAVLRLFKVRVPSCKIL
jgi:hypothetical protein